MADRVALTSQKDNCSISTIFESVLMLGQFLQLCYLLVHLWFLLRGGTCWIEQSGFTMSFCVLPVYTARVCCSFYFLSTDSCLLISLPEDLLDNKIWEAQFFRCVSSSHVLIVGEGKPSLIPGIGFQCLQELRLLTMAFRITSQVPAHLPLRGGRKKMGLKLGTYPFPRGSSSIKLHL